ncbi:MAG: zinc ABC transporter substrate-binding protein [Christensenellales bacterium]|nr:zinc ABC transporter substrate-binding protein [Christensenellales bacterium]
MFHRISRISALLILVILTLTSCHPIVEEVTPPLNVAATCYPIFALTSAIVEDVPDIELSCLMDPQDGCIRNYSLSDWDLYLLAYSADLIIQGGEGLESYSDTLQTISDSGGVALAKVLYGLELMKGQEKQEEDDGQDSHLSGNNPHLYMSWDGGMDMLRSIAVMMTKADPSYGAVYAKSIETAIQQVESLKAEALELLEGYAGAKVILMNECMGYVAADYQLQAVEWIDRESGENLYESELEDCLKKLQDSGAKVILIEKQAPAALVRHLSEAGFSVAKLDVMSTLREEDGFEGYLAAMQQNAREILSAFQRMNIDSSEGNI